MTAAGTDGDLDMAVPCPICRSYVMDIHRLTADIRRGKPFAHAHHVIRGGMRSALTDLTGLKDKYRKHKDRHTTPAGDADYQRLTRALAEHLADHVNGDTA